MKLDDKEQQEINLLHEMQRSNMPLSPFRYDRLIYLHRKEFHNCCSNPKCTGYEGTEIETICPKCQSELFKVIATV